MALDCTCLQGQIQPSKFVPCSYHANLQFSLVIEISIMTLENILGTPRAIHDIIMCAGLGIKLVTLTQMCIPKNQVLAKFVASWLFIVAWSSVNAQIKSDL